MTLAQNGTALPFTLNQSEISSFILLGPFALLQIQRVRLRAFTRRWRVLLVGTAAVFVTITAWYLISLPPILASVLFLDRVEAKRAILGVGLGGILLMALFCAAQFEREEIPHSDPQGDRATAPPDRHRRIVTGAVICGAIAFGMYFWAGRSLRETAPGLNMSLWTAGIVSVAAGVVVALVCARKVLWGGVALVVLGAAISLPANPLYQGLGPLTNSPILSTFDSVAANPPDATHRAWLSFASKNLNTVLVASGHQTLNASDVYPNAKVWRVLAPDHKHRFVWDRYANLSFAPAPSGTSPMLTLLGTFHGSVQISIDPCGSASGRLGVGFVVSASPLTGSCLRLDTKTTFDGSPTYIYTRTVSGST